MRVLNPSRKRQYLSLMEDWLEKNYQKIPNLGEEYGWGHLQLKEGVSIYVKHILDVSPTRTWIDWQLKLMRNNLLTLGKAFKEEIHPSLRPYNRFKHIFDFARANHVVEILSYNPKNKDEDTVLDDLMKIEKKWLEKKSDKRRIINVGRPVVDCGGGFYWFMLDERGCRVTAEAMGHCGNVGGREDDRILNLGKKVKGGYEVSLTFVLNKGVVGEMKGFGNSKPSAKYHPQITCLFLSDYVNFVSGGGYAPENNFHLKDMTKKEQDFLLRHKPYLFDLKKLINRADLETVKRTLSGIGIWDGKIIEADGKYELVLYPNTEMTTIVGDYFSKDFINVYDQIENLDTYHEFSNFTERDIKDVLGSVPEKILKKLDKFLVKEGNYNPKKDRMSEAIINHDEVSMAFHSAIARGMESGYEQSLRKQVEEHIVESFDSIGATLVCDYILDGKAKASLYLPLDKVVEAYEKDQQKYGEFYFGEFWESIAQEVSAGKFKYHDNYDFDEHWFLEVLKENLEDIGVI